MSDPKELPKVGTIVKTTIGEHDVAVDYKVLDKLFARTLPYAVIVNGPNTGVEVILHRWPGKDATTESPA